MQKVEKIKKEKKVFEVVKENMDGMMKLIRCGLVDPSRLNHYQVYSFYSTLDAITKKADRITFTAESMGISEHSVAKIVAKFEKSVNL